MNPKNSQGFLLAMRMSERIIMSERRYTNKEVYQRTVLAAITTFIVLTILMDIIVGLIMACGTILIVPHFAKQVKVE